MIRVQEAPTKAWQHRHGTEASAIHQSDCKTAMNYVQPRRRRKNCSKQQEDLRVVGSGTAPL
eukprot:8028036-Lingulodinium_polyedra.AAC.1